MTAFVVGLIAVEIVFTIVAAHAAYESFIERDWKDFLVALVASLSSFVLCIVMLGDLCGILYPS